MSARGTRHWIVDTHSYECRHIRHHLYFRLIPRRIHGNAPQSSTNCRNSIYKRRQYSDRARPFAGVFSLPEHQSTSWDATAKFPGIYNESLRRKLVRGGHVQKIGRFCGFSRFSGSTHNSRQISYQWVYMGTLDHADSEYGHPTAHPRLIRKLLSIYVFSRHLQRCRRSPSTYLGHLGSSISSANFGSTTPPRSEKNYSWSSTTMQTKPNTCGYRARRALQHMKRIRPRIGSQCRENVYTFYLAYGCPEKLFEPRF